MRGAKANVLRMRRDEQKKWIVIWWGHHIINAGHRLDYYTFYVRRCSRFSFVVSRCWVTKWLSTFIFIIVCRVCIWSRFCGHTTRTIPHCRERERKADDQRRKKDRRKKQIGSDGWIVLVWLSVSVSDARESTIGGGMAYMYSFTV